MAGPEEEVEETELLKIALARVSPTYRPCLILYVIEEFSQRQIAEMLQIKESSVGKYVSRGKEELRQIYRRLANEPNALPACAPATRFVPGCIQDISGMPSART